MPLFCYWAVQTYYHRCNYSDNTWKFSVAQIHHQYHRSTDLGSNHILAKICKMAVGREFWRSKVENKTVSLAAVILGIVLTLDNLFFSASFLTQLSNPCGIYYCYILPSSLYLQYYLNCRSWGGSILIVLATVSTNFKIKEFCGR